MMMGEQGDWTRSDPKQYFVTYYLAFEGILQRRKDVIHGV